MATGASDLEDIGTGSTGLQDVETAQLLDTVDKLRSLGSLSQDISLPQIIVVGQQSSGKSSVLEAISGIPFPVNDGLCTQFATEVILRRSQEIKRSATINALDIFDARIAQRGYFAEKWKSFDISQLGDIIIEAKECMGLKENGISKDKLRLEISGPDQDHLTLVDLPGLIVNARLSQSDNTVDSIRNLVTGYMKQPLSTILAVVSGQADLENQGILGLLKNFDGGSKVKKTLGVITQPDTIHAGTVREKTFLALAENTEFPLTLGWHVLRNLSSKEKEDGKDRARVEKDFFDTTSPWCNLLPQRIGIDTLKKRLSKVLLSEIASQLGNILAHIEKVIGETALSLDKLGDERSTSEQQRAFLIKLGDQYRHLVSCALEGEYHDAFFNQYTHRLRARIVNENIKFANSMVEQGHRWNIKVSDAPVGFGALLSNFDAPTANRKQLLAHVQEMQRSYRGNELHGIFPVGLVGRLFKEQACNWKKIATEHVMTIFEFVKEFMKDLLHHVAETEVSWTLLENLIDPEMDRKSNLLNDKLDELLRPYLVAHPVTLNMRYVKTLTEARKKWQPSDNINSNVVFGAPQVIDVLACEQVIDTMEAYYDIALSVFVDNVATLAIESCLLSDLPQLISPIQIAKESVLRLAILGAESPETSSTRQRLRRKLAEYEEGRNTIRQHVQRHARIAGRATDNFSTNGVPNDSKQTQPVKQETSIVFAQPQPKTSTDSNLFGAAGLFGKKPASTASSPFGGAVSVLATDTKSNSQPTGAFGQQTLPLFTLSNSTSSTNKTVGTPFSWVPSPDTAATTNSKTDNSPPDNKGKNIFGLAFTDLNKSNESQTQPVSGGGGPFASLLSQAAKNSQAAPTTGPVSIFGPGPAFGTGTGTGAGAGAGQNGTATSTASQR